MNSHIRLTAAQYAAAGYLAIAPALFDRLQRDVELGYDPAGLQAGIDLMMKATNEGAIADLDAAIGAAAHAGRVGLVGYCWGGRVAWLAGCRLIGVFVVAALAGLGAVLPARAQSSDASAGWRFEFMPLFWASGVKADIMSAAGEQDIDVSFSDILKDVHFGALGTFEGRKGRWGFLFDGMYVDIRKSIPQAGTMPGDVGLKAKQSNVSLAGTLRLAGGRLAFDLLAGARYSNMDNVLTVMTGPFEGFESISKESWWDAITGVRLIYSLANAWRLIGYFDIGAGGSQLSWQAKGAVDWRLSKVLSLGAGYRHFYFDRFANDVSTKMVESGVYLGLGIWF